MSVRQWRSLREALFCLDDGGFTTQGLSSSFITKYFKQWAANPGLFCQANGSHNVETEIGGGAHLIVCNESNLLTFR